MKAFYNYLKYILIHKYWVWFYGRKIGVPRWILFWHDWTKFLPDEFIHYKRTFYNSKTGEGQYRKSNDFAIAWNLHQKRNKHHFQAWILRWDNGEYEALEMPLVYILEMAADWAGASKMHNGSPYDYYQKVSSVTELAPISRKIFEGLLEYLHINYFKMPE